MTVERREVHLAGRIFASLVFAKITQLFAHQLSLEESDR